MTSPRPGPAPGAPARRARAAWVTLLALLTGLSSLAWAAPAVRPAADPRPMAPRPAVDDDVEDVEPVEDVMAVGATPGAAHPAAAPKASPKGGLTHALPRFHAALVHFPIAWLVLLVLIDLRTVAWGKPGWERLGLLVLGLTLGSMVLASITGLLRADQLPRAPDTISLIIAHRNLALITAGVTAAAFGLRLARRNRLTGSWRWVYLSLVAAAAGLVLITGHRGAALVFGADFLPF